MIKVGIVGMGVIGTHIAMAIDTGILRTVDERQWAWIERALGRSRGKFTMAIVGHPRFAGGRDLPPTAEGHDVSESSGNFAALYRRVTISVKEGIAAQPGNRHQHGIRPVPRECDSLATVP